MIGLSRIVGQPAAVELLGRMLREDRVPHALLFEGAESSGKATCARAFGAALLCEGRSDAACGACASCRLLAKGAHPDWIVVTLEVKKTARAASRNARDAGHAVPQEDLSRFIVVDQVREVSRLAALTPRMGRRRVFLVDPADQMNVEAQNALLKTLEEPPAGSLAMLVAARAHALLPTVRSRCFRVPFAPLAGRDLARILRERGVPAAEAVERAALAGGRASAAIEMDLEDARARRMHWLSALERLATSGAAPRDLGPLAAELAGRHEADLVETLDLLVGLLRDSARAAAAGTPIGLIHADQAERLAAVGDRLGAARCARLIESAERLRGDLRLNLNRTLVAEALLAALAGGPVP